jgi:circadian clock protein KaiB
MPQKYVLKLYTVESCSTGVLALRNLKEIISQESKTVFQLEVIDVRKNPQMAEDDKILAIPTLIKKLPPPIKKIIGDLSDKEKLLLDLDLIPQNKNNDVRVRRLQ